MDGIDLRRHPQAARGHMPFAGHRSQRDVRLDEERKRMLRALGQP